jgi:signal transduction histidine kinase
VLNLGLLLAGCLLATGVFLYSHWTISRMSAEIEATSRVMAHFCAQATFPATENPQVRSLMTEMMGSSIDFPIVLTDHLGFPRAWRGIDVDPGDVSVETLDSLFFGQPVSPVMAERVRQVRLTATRLKAKNPPIPVTLAAGTDTLGYLCYGEPAVLDLLRWMPYVSVFGMALLVALAFWGFALLRQSEKRTIWVGMAKETAHQLGTPLSSLMGWSDLLRDHLSQSRDGELRMPAAAMEETVSEIERDVDRLRRVAQRFSNVGSEPNLQEGEVEPVVRDVAAYMRKRIPHAGGAVELVERYEPVPRAKFNAELLAWAIENLIANAAGALDRWPATIEVRLAAGRGGSVEISVRDTGRGMSPKEQRRAFDPGYTTKPRGWGLGLPLARRVVEDYHNGRIWIRHSAPGQGTTMVIRLPAAA